MSTDNAPSSQTEEPRTAKVQASPIADGTIKILLDDGSNEGASPMTENNRPSNVIKFEGITNAADDAEDEKSAIESKTDTENNESGANKAADDNNAPVGARVNEQGSRDAISDEEFEKLIAQLDDSGSWKAESEMSRSWLEVKAGASAQADLPDIFEAKIAEYTGHIGSKKISHARIGKIARIINKQLRKAGRNVMVAAIEQTFTPVVSLDKERIRKADPKWFDISEWPDIYEDTLLVFRFLDGCRVKVEGCEMTPSSIKALCETEGIGCDLFLGHGKRTKMENMKHQTKMLEVTAFLSSVMEFATAFACIYAGLTRSAILLLPVAILLLMRRNPFPPLIIDGVDGQPLSRLYAYMDFWHTRLPEERPEMQRASDLADVAYRTIAQSKARWRSIRHIIMVAVFLIAACLTLLLGTPPSAEDAASVTSTGASIWD